MRLIILGTGNAGATKCFNTCFALEEEGQYFLVDAGGGNGIFTQLERSGISCGKIREMFLTHGHTDHILGAIWIVREIATRMCAGTYEGSFIIYGHDEVIKMLRIFCEMTLTKKLLRMLDERILFKIVSDGERVSVFSMEIEFFDIHSTKAKQYGFVSRMADGTKLVCLGDEPFNEMNRRVVENCDWLLAEAFCLYEDRERFKPYEKNHSTALDLGKLATDLHAKRVVVYHTEDTDLKNRRARYTGEVASQFKGMVIVPDDLEQIEIC